MADDTDDLLARAAELKKLSAKPLLRDDLGREAQAGLSAREAARVINLICDLALAAHRLGMRACDEALADLAQQRAALARGRRRNT